MEFRLHCTRRGQCAVLDLIIERKDVKDLWTLLFSFDLTLALARKILIFSCNANKKVLTASELIILHKSSLT